MTEMGRTCSTMEQFKNAYRVLMEKPESTRPLGRVRHRWEDNIKMDSREVGYDPRDWITLAEDEQSSFSNLSVTSPMSQLILQPFRRFTYVTAHSPTLPLLHLHHSSFSNPSFVSPTSQALHLIHLASRT